VGNVVEGSHVRDLPLKGRSLVQLTQLMPGVSTDSTFDSKNKGLMAGVDFSVNGNNTTGNLFLVDGVNNNDIGSNRTILVYPSIDAIQEFKILRNSYPPEFGQAMGAIINGAAAHGGIVKPYGSTFFVFTDYMRPAARVNYHVNVAFITEAPPQHWLFEKSGPWDALFPEHQSRPAGRNARRPVPAAQVSDLRRTSGPVSESYGRSKSPDRSRS